MSGPGHGEQGYGPPGDGQPGYGPPGYGPPGYGPPGYGPPGYGPPGYGPPGYGQPGFGQPSYGPPGYGPPGSGPPGPPGPGGGPPRRRTGLIVALAVVGVLVLLGAGIAVVALASSGSSSTDASPSGSPAASATPSATPTTSASASSTPTTSLSVAQMFGVPGNGDCRAGAQGLTSRESDGLLCQDSRLGKTFLRYSGTTASYVDSTAASFTTWARYAGNDCVTNYAATGRRPDGTAFNVIVDVYTQRPYAVFLLSEDLTLQQLYDTKYYTADQNYLCGGG